MTKSFLVTGATGQVGSQLIDYILETTTHNVLIMMRWQEPFDNLYHLSERINSCDRLKICYADLNDYPSIYRLLSDHKPDFISHLAAQSFPRTSFDIPLETLSTNIIGTASLLEAIKNLKQDFGYDPIIHVCSSSEVYGKVKSTEPITESTPFHGASPYSISKIGTDYLGQFYAEAYKLNTFITRMGTHSGPRRSDVFFESTVAKQIALIEAQLQAPTLYIGNLNSIRTFQDCRDAVRAYYLLFDAFADGKFERGETFNIAGSEVFHLKDVVDIFLDLSTVSPISVEVDPNRLRPLDADYQMFDNTKLKSVINWSPCISAKNMFSDLLDHWRLRVSSGTIPVNR